MCWEPNFDWNTNFAFLDPKHCILPVQRKYLTQHPQTIVNLFAQSNLVAWQFIGAQYTETRGHGAG
jgi:hypothetical protein